MGTESKGCFDTFSSGSGYMGDTKRGHYTDGTSSHCKYLKHHNQCKNWGKACEKTCGICQAVIGTAAPTATAQPSVTGTSSPTATAAPSVIGTARPPVIGTAAPSV